MMVHRALEIPQDLSYIRIGLRCMNKISWYWGEHLWWSVQERGERVLLLNVTDHSLRPLKRIPKFLNFKNFLTFGFHSPSVLGTGCLEPCRWEVWQTVSMEIISNNWWQGPLSPSTPFPHPWESMATIQFLFHHRLLPCVSLITFTYDKSGYDPYRKLRIQRVKSYKPNILGVLESKK